MPVFKSWPCWGVINYMHIHQYRYGCHSSLFILPMSWRRTCMPNRLKFWPIWDLQTPNFTQPVLILYMSHYSVPAFLSYRDYFTCISNLKHSFWKQKQLSCTWWNAGYSPWIISTHYVYMYVMGALYIPAQGVCMYALQHRDTVHTQTL